MKTIIYAFCLLIAFSGIPVIPEAPAAQPRSQRESRQQIPTRPAGGEQQSTSSAAQGAQTQSQDGPGPLRRVEQFSLSARNPRGNQQAKRQQRQQRQIRQQQKKKKIQQQRQQRQQQKQVRQQQQKKKIQQRRQQRQLKQQQRKDRKQATQQKRKEKRQLLKQQRQQRNRQQPRGQQPTAGFREFAGANGQGGVVRQGQTAGPDAGQWLQNQNAGQGSSASSLAMLTQPARPPQQQVVSGQAIAGQQPAANRSQSAVMQQLVSVPRQTDRQ